MVKQSLTEKTIKNSLYSVSSVIISRVGGLIFIIILARLLLPEGFGIYNLVLSIALIAITLTDLGVGTTLVRYVSEALGKNERRKASAYIKYLFKFRFFLVMTVIFIIVIFGKFISYQIFQKPAMYFPLLFAGFYILMQLFFGFFNAVFSAIKDLRKIALTQIVFQVFRIGLVILAISLISDTRVVSGVFIALAIAVFLSSLIAFIISDKKLIFGDSKKEKIDKVRVLKYLGFVSLASISLTFFGSVDTLMLGRFVEVEFLGFYGAALGVVTTIGSLFSFGGVLLPIFTQIQGDRLERGFNKVFKSIVIFTIPSVMGIIIFGKYFIRAVYGKEYLIAAIPLYALAFTIIILPIISLYSTLFAAKEKPKVLSKFVLISLGINIVLNFVLIRFLFGFGQEYAILGAGIATVVSRSFFMFSLIRKSRQFTNLKGEHKFLVKPLIASIVMAGFLILFIYLVNITLILGILGIILGAGIYFGVLWKIKGIEKQEIYLLKRIFIKKYRDIKTTKRL